MKKLVITISVVALLVACNDQGSKTTSGDTTTINTQTENTADGGPNNGLGDTTSYNRMNDTVHKDSARK